MNPPRRLVVPLSCCLLAATTLLGGCEAPIRHSRAQTVASADRTACRQRADEIYNKQNRAEVYRSDTFATDTLDSPYSVSGLPGITTNGLSGLYQHDNLVSSCVNNHNSPGSGSDPAGPAATTSTSPPASR